MNSSYTNYKKHYIKGFVLLGSGLLIILFGVIFPFIIKDNELISFVSIGIIFIGTIILIFSFYLLKKANNLRLDYLLSNKTNEKFHKRK
jgi:hypothetical protein